MLSPEVRREIVRWSWSAVIVGTAHGALLAGLLVEVHFGSPPPVSQAAMVVEIAPTPLSIAIPPTEIPPGPQQVEAHREHRHEQRVERLKFTPPPHVKLPRPPELVVQHQTEERPQERVVDQKSVETTTALPTTVAPPDERVTAPRAGAASNSTSSPEQTWESELLATIERNKRYPGLAQRQRQEDVVYVRFCVDRRGKVLEYSIERSRGFTLLDREVIALLQRSSPLPAPPDEVTGERIEVVVPIEFYIRRGRS